MSEHLKHISGHVFISNQMLQQAREDEQAIRDHLHRMRTDPEYAAEWQRRMDEEHDESRELDAVDELVKQLLGSLKGAWWLGKRADQFAAEIKDRELSYDDVQALWHAVSWHLAYEAANTTPSVVVDRMRDALAQMPLEGRA